MRLLQTIKKNPLRTFTLLYVIASGIVIYILLGNLRDALLNVKIDYRDRIVLDKNGKKHYQIPQDYFSVKEQNQILKAETKQYRDLIGNKDAQIESVTDLYGQVSDSLRVKKVELSEAKTKQWYWEKEYKSGAKFTATMDEKDSILIPKGDLRLKILDVTEGKGKNKKFYTDVSDEDGIFTLNGSKVVRTERKEIKDIYSLNLKNDFYLDFMAKPRFFKSELELQLFPDGKFIPKVGAGALIDFENKSRMFWKVGLDIPISKTSR